MAARGKIKGWVIGVDPGQEGAIACLPLDSSCGIIHNLVQVYDIPQSTGRDKKKQIDALALDNLCRDIAQSDVLMVMVEDQWGRPGHSANAVFKLGTNFGKLVSSLEVHFNPFLHYVAPTTWQSSVRKPVIENLNPTAKGKEMSLLVGAYLFPHVDIRRNHNKADALLIAKYGYDRYCEGENR